MDIIFESKNGEYIWTTEWRKCLNERKANIFEPENGEYI